MTELKIGGKYLHYKGKLYKVTGTAIHSETLEKMVIYEALYENPIGKTWVRPLKMFLEDIQFEGKEVPRFKLID